MLEVMFYEVFKEEQQALKKFLPKHFKVGFTSKTIQERGDKTPPASLICIRTQSIIPLDWGSQIKGVLSRSQGHDHLVKYRREICKNIPCGYLGNYSARSVAEHAILAMMMLMKKMKRQMSQFDTFLRDDITGLECRGHRALIVGVGNIGLEIVDLARGLKMQVKGVDIKRRSKNIPYVSLDQGIRWADVIFCALPLTEQTRGLLGYNNLKKARPGLIFVNISRGEISPIKDMEKLFREGILSGLSLDVYEDEPRLASFLRGYKKDKTPTIKKILRLKDKDNVLFTPHNAFNTQETLEEKARLTVEAVVSFLKTKKFLFPVPVEKN